MEGLGIAVSAVGFGFVYGLSAREAGFSPIEAVAMSTIVFAGAAQFAAIGYVVSGLAWPGDRPADRPAECAPPAVFGRARAVAAERAVLASRRDGAPADRRGLRPDDRPLSTDRADRRARLLDRRRSARPSSRGISRRWPACCSAPRSGPGALRHRHHLPGGHDRARGRADHRPAGARGGHRRRGCRRRGGVADEPVRSASWPAGSWVRRWACSSRRPRRTRRRRSGRTRRPSAIRCPGRASTDRIDPIGRRAARHEHRLRPPRRAHVRRDLSDAGPWAPDAGPGAAAAEGLRVPPAGRARRADGHRRGQRDGGRRTRPGRRRSMSASSGWPCSSAWRITAWRKNLLLGLIAAVALVAIARATGLAAMPA